VRKGRGTRVALTASHSSTIVEESLRLLRTLHSFPQWTQKINEFICLKLGVVNEIVAEIPILQVRKFSKKIENLRNKDAKLPN